MLPLIELVVVLVLVTLQVHRSGRRTPAHLEQATRQLPLPIFLLRDLLQVLNLQPLLFGGGPHIPLPRILRLLITLRLTPALPHIHLLLHIPRPLRILHPHLTPRPVLSPLIHPIPLLRASHTPTSRAPTSITRDGSPHRTQKLLVRLSVSYKNRSELRWHARLESLAAYPRMTSSSCSKNTIDDGRTLYHRRILSDGLAYLGQLLDHRTVPKI